MHIHYQLNIFHADGNILWHGMLVTGICSMYIHSHMDIFMRMVTFYVFRLYAALAGAPWHACGRKGQSKL